MINSYHNELGSMLSIVHRIYIDIWELMVYINDIIIWFIIV